MRYLALATDYDGTLAHHGRVGGATLAGLERLLASGRRLILVTGRELDDLRATFDHLELFERVVAENGAVVYHPAAKAQRLLAAPPPEDFVRALVRRGVHPISVGRAIVATWKPHETAVLETIRDLGLDSQVIFNKDAVMVLPSGVTKASGLAVALADLGLSPHNVVGVGDAENDHAFLRICECSVAVANALPALQQLADFTSKGDHGAGVVELIDEIVADDLAGREPLLSRHHILLGTCKAGEVRLPPYACNLLIAGSSGGGKSTLTTALLERLTEAGYQYCVVDPEGDYEGLEGAVVVGGREHPPTVEQANQLLGKPDANAVVDLVGLPLAERPPFFLALLPHLQELRARTGRPHWIVVDETHHLLPNAWAPPRQTLPQELNGVVRITVRPDAVAPAALMSVDTVVALGDDPAAVLAQFAATVGIPAPTVTGVILDTGEVLIWERSAGRAPYKAKIAPGKAQRRRHSRKYATGELPPDRSFYFRGPERKLNLRAQNLMLFLQLAEGVDDETWQFHLLNGDYENWFRERIKDDELADESAEIARKSELPAAGSRKLIREAVERRYTQPATPPLPMPETDAAPVHQGDPS